MNRLIRKTIPLTATLLILQGCVSAPPEVSASIPLIGKQVTQEGDYLPKEIQTTISATESGKVIPFNNKKIIVGRKYMSAMGLNCKEVIITDTSSMNYETSICKSKQGWFLVPDLMAKQTSEYIEG